MTDKPLLTKWRLMMRAIKDQRLTCADLRVLPAVLERMNDKLECWPGYARIASDTGTTRRTSTRSIVRLVELGYLEKQSRGICRSNLYRISKLSTQPSIDIAVDSDTQDDSAIDGRVTSAIDGRVTQNLTQLNRTQLNRTHTDAHDVRFGDFWKIYPNKQGKADALKSWKRQKLDSIADKIISDVEARLRDPGQWKGKSKKYIPYGSTYINKRRFEDEWTPEANHARLPREEMTEAEINEFNKQQAAKFATRSKA